MAIEFQQIKRKWLLLGDYKPPIQSDSEFTEEIIMNSQSLYTFL